MRYLLYIKFFIFGFLFNYFYLLYLYLEFQSIRHIIEKLEYNTFSYFFYLVELFTFNYFVESLILAFILLTVCFFGLIILLSLEIFINK